MQVKIFNKDWSHFKNLDNADITKISVKNWGSFSTDQFEDIISKYVTFEETWLLANSWFDNRFTIWIIWDYKIVNDQHQYKVIDILNDFKRWHIIWWWTSQSWTFAAVSAVITAHYKWNNSWIDIFNIISETSATVNTFYYTLKFNSYDALTEIIKQTLSTYTYRYKFLNQNIINSIDLEFWLSWTTHKLYRSPQWIWFYINKLSYTLSIETLANYVYVFNSSWTLVTTLVDSTSITNYWKRVKVLNLSTSDGSEASKWQQYFDKYKNPYPIIQNLEISKKTTTTWIKVWDSIKIMSEWVKEELFVNSNFLIEDIVYNWWSDTYNLIIWDIINNTYLK